MQTSAELDEPIDGRTARAVRTKDAIVDATLALIDEGDLRPTGPRIAERAGVSVRSIFQHFDDLDALFSAVGERVSVRIRALVAPIDSDMALADRVTKFTAQRTDVLEALTPVLRAALVHAASSTVIRNQFEAGHGHFQTQIDDVFAHELAEATSPSSLRGALIMAFSWPSWDVLRRAEGLSEAEATAVVDWMARAALVASGFTA